MDEYKETLVNSTFSLKSTCFDVAATFPFRTRKIELPRSRWSVQEIQFATLINEKRRLAVQKLVTRAFITHQKYLIPRCMLYFLNGFSLIEINDYVSKRKHDRT